MSAKRTRGQKEECGLLTKFIVGGVKKQNGVVLSYGHKRKAIIYTDISEYETKVNWECELLGG